MFRKSTISILALAAVAAAALASGSVAQQAVPTTPQPGMMQGMGQGMGNGPMMGRGMGPMMGAGPGLGFEENFAAIDTDKDGRITMEEITVWRSARVGSMDANADGKLSAEELAAGRIADMTARIQARTAEMVAMMDADGDGLLSAAEMETRPILSDDVRAGRCERGWRHHRGRDRRDAGADAGPGRHGPRAGRRADDGPGARRSWPRRGPGLGLVELS
ncbi:MAG: hypothetical protein HZT43_15120 [Exiguobacterium profundum]|nr:MAG: hypothetical protein HZT43_15120 [Exiguobacterium profundum]